MMDDFLREHGSADLKVFKDYKFIHYDLRLYLSDLPHREDAYQRELAKAGYGEITTEILPAPEFYFAEDYHQQYLDANPNGYCPVHSTGVRLGPVERMEQV